MLIVELSLGKTARDTNLFGESAVVLNIMNDLKHGYNGMKSVRWSLVLNDAHGMHSHPKPRQHHQHISAVCSVHLPHANTTSAKTMKILPRRTGMHGVNPGNG
jgi:hypothetical protein